MPSYRTKNKTNDRNACKVFRFGLIGKSLTPSVDERQKMKSHEFDKESSPETHVEFLLVTNLIINICIIVENKRNDSFILIIYGSHVGERLTSVCFLCALTLHGYICFFIPQKKSQSDEHTSEAISDMIWESCECAIVYQINWGNPQCFTKSIAQRPAAKALLEVNHQVARINDTDLTMGSAPSFTRFMAFMHEVISIMG